MNIGTIIRNLRRGKDMTQEQLAEYMNVSAQAVSRWETGATLPDITQLPVLAHVFDVTSDTLLGIDIAEKETRIEKIVNDTRENYGAKGRKKEAVEILREALKEYPNSYRLMESLAYELGFFCGSSEDPDERKANLTEVITLGEKILAECTDDGIRHSTIQTLCFAYKDNGERDKARALAEKMPTTVLSKEHLLCHVLQGTEMYVQKQNTLIYDMDVALREMARFAVTLDDGSKPYTLNERIAIEHKVLDIFDILYEDGNFGFYHVRVIDAHRHLVSHYTEKGDIDAAVKHLRLATNHAIIFDKESNDKDREYTCLLFRGLKQYTGYSSTSQENEASELLKFLKDAKFDPIRQHPEFTAIESELREAQGPRWK